MKLSKRFFLTALFPVATLFANAQSDLFKTLQKQDSLMFEVTFNTCDLRPLEYLVSENFEFYHDKGGITNGKRDFINSLKNGLCAHPESYQSRRELVKGSMEVYPLEKNGVLYGAIQSGRHRFYETVKGKPERFASIARFSHVWLLEEGTWRFARGLSFDHQTIDAPDKEETLFENDAAVEKWLAQNNIPALGLGIIRDGKLKEVKVYGNLKKGSPAPYDALFNVASLTKPVVAMVTLRLVSAGKWKLDEPLFNYWIDPDLKDDPRHKVLTTRHVLTHQTGFPNWRWNNADKKLAFGADPGTKYGYSGEGFEYLRKALEKKFKKTLDELAKETLLTPVGMDDTRFYWNTAVDESRFAVGHNPKGDLYKINRNTYANAADDLLTTVEDYGKFLVSVLNADGLTKAVFDEMVSRQVKTKENKYFGLGWEIYDFGNGEYALSHGGADEGVKTQVFLMPKSKQGIIIFTNVDDGHKTYLPLVKTYLGNFGQQIIDIEMGKK
jgi:CubicO group peptidase (beta-lactamase class C family)